MKKLILSLLFLAIPGLLLASPPVRTYTYTEGTTISATEVTTNEDNIYNYLSTGVDKYAAGTIKNVDIASDAGIIDTKLAQITTASKVSGTALTGLASIPSGAGSIPVANLNSFSTVNPTNLLSNGNFENHSAGTTAVPDGWVLVLTPTLATDTGDVGYGSISQKITAAGAGLEGIQFTTGTLKPTTSYTLSVRVKVTAGDTASIITTGATTNLALESTSATYELKTGTFVTDGSGTAVVIKLLAKADGDIVWFDGVQVNQGESAFAFADKPASEGVWADYFATSTKVGWVTPIGQIMVTKIGKTVFVNFSISGISNADTTTFTVPYAFATDGGPQTAGGRFVDNTSTVAGGEINYTSTNTIQLFTSFARVLWTESGTKAVYGQFFYESA